MKKTIICALLLFVVTVVWSQKYDFKVDSLCYSILSVSERTVEVAREKKDNGRVEKVGDIVIPETVQFNGKTFTVTAIGSYAFGRQDINSISIPKTVKKIKRIAFKETKIAGTFRIPKTVEGMISFPDAESLIIEESDKPLRIYIKDREDDVSYDHWGSDEENSSKNIYIGRTLERENGSNVGIYVGAATETLTFGKLVSAKCVAANIAWCINFKKGGVFERKDAVPITVKLEHEAPPVLKGEFETNVYLNVKLLVPAVSLSKYQSAPIWKDFFNIEGY